MNTNNNINQTLPNGIKYPFHQSDDYFDNLTNRVMDRISAEEKTGLSHQRGIVVGLQSSVWYKVLSVAASFVLIAVVATVLLSNPKDVNTQIANEDFASESFDDDFNEALMTYTMADNMDVYYYLSSGGAELALSGK